jgi:hypothetical protein
MSCKVTAVAWFNVALVAASDASPREEYERKCRVYGSVVIGQAWEII